MTMSIGAFISSSSGSISAALPSTPIESGRRSSRAATATRDGVLEGVGLLVEVAVLDAAGDPRLVDSMQIATPSFMVTASGCAPPMPPSPAVSVIVPASVPPNCLSATAAKVSKVPCRMPWVPM